MKSPYLQFILQRVPIIPQLLLSYGFSYSGLYLTGVETNLVHFVSFIVFMFLTQLRFMDEIKDFEKDKIANPDRPLPKGLISAQSVLKGITILGTILIVLNICTFALSQTGGVWLMITLIWLLLMYKEFFLGEKLAEYPLVYAITHQIIIVPLVLFIATTLNPDSEITNTVNYSFMVFGGFFSYEIGRKLNPNAHEVLKTYLKVYGLPITILLTVILMAISCYFANSLNLLKPIGISSTLALASYFILFSKPNIYKLTELLITLNLLLILWIIPLKNWINL